MTERLSKRRTRHMIVVEIPKKAKGGARKTHIMYEVGLIHDQNEEYLNALRKAGFIAEKSGTWETTEKGLLVVEACGICHNLMEKIQFSRFSGKKIFLVGRDAGLVQNGCARTCSPIQSPQSSSSWFFNECK